MEVIIPSHGNTLKILGKPKASTNGYRPMTYVVEQPVADGVLLFHVLTRELLLLSAEEYANRYQLSELYEKWFLVPEALDDRKYADQVRLIRKTVQKKPEHITNYTIFTTTDCNARCFYCYELGRSRIPMSEETAHKAANYIAAHCGGKEVTLAWFGGEPLFNKAVIDIICQDLQALGVDYHSTMISNGYLFDSETAHQAASLWKLKRVQVSMDGAGEIYNRSKAFIYKNGPSPYEVVMGNIGHLLDEQITVQVRINLDKHNAEEAAQLVQDLHERYRGRKGLYAYSHTLFEHAGPREIKRAAEERRSLIARQRALADMISDYGFGQKFALGKQLPLNMCMADSGTTRTILPGGELGLCDHYSENNFVGHIDREEQDQAMIQKFRENWQPLEACRTCFRYPECIRLKMCQEQEDCFEETRQKSREEMLQAMQNMYEAWKNKEEEPEEADPVC